MRFLPLLALCLLCSPAFALELDMPVDCAMGQDCVVQNYVDHDSGAGYRDHTCRHLSYDGHKGVDIRTMNRAVMHRGVTVLAAADGKVLGMRDGVEDLAPVIEGKECGNGVLLAHGQGWTTQYCHLRKGSLVVRKGETVRAGQPLGLIGMSGNTAFPHVHLSVARDGTPVDPYTGTSMQDACGGEAQPLWSAAAAEKLSYVDSGILGAGFADRKLTGEELQNGEHHPSVLPAGKPILLFWAEFFGLEKDDAVYLALRDPQGKTEAEMDVVMPRSRAVQHYQVGKRKAQGWPQGRYEGVVRVQRDGKTIIEKTYDLQVRHD